VAQTTKRFFNSDPNVNREQDVHFQIVKARRGFIVERFGWTARPNAIQIGRFKTLEAAQNFVQGYTLA
jgi:hypothetical protein